MYSTTDNSGIDAAKAEIRSISNMVMRLRHVSNCDGDTDLCDMSVDDMYNQLLEIDGQPDRDSLVDDYHDKQNAMAAIREDALGVAVRSSWQLISESGQNTGDCPDMTPTEYMIELSTGGPATRLTGEMDSDYNPESVYLEYSDSQHGWSKFMLRDDEEDIFMEYARIALRGE